MTSVDFYANPPFKWVHVAFFGHQSKHKLLTALL